MSKIGWTDKTWNPVTGCTAVSPGCTNCYAATMTRRLQSTGHRRYQGLMGEHHFNGTVQCHTDMLDKPLGGKKACMVFVNSMSDLFHDGVPEEFIAKVFMVMDRASHHNYQILTKRADRMAQVCANAPWFLKVLNWGGARSGEHTCSRQILPNVWLGTSCENQDALEERVPQLLRCPAVVRFLSLEPLLGPIYCSMALETPEPAAFIGGGGIDWVIVGCESGTKRRSCRWEWVESIVGQCRDAGVRVFVKQLARNSDGTGAIYKHKPGDAWPSWVPSWARVQEFPK